MKSVKIKGKSGETSILVGESLQHLSQYVPLERVIIIADDRVAELYGDSFPPCRKIIIGQGESQKTLTTIQTIYTQLMDFGADRSTWVVGIGGGIVCDITGFAASTYMRGIQFGYVATTLLAQVDASVGGKNGVNFKGYKNMVGVFNQPEFVICDLTMLTSLPEREIVCGMAEIVKHGAIADAELFSYLEQNTSKALSLDPNVLERLVLDSVLIKAAVVNRDELETGERRKLNFGHTFGHAIEKTTDLSHGQAVSVGMVIAAQLSAMHGSLKNDDIRRLNQLLGGLGLPLGAKVNADKVWNALQKDKKKEGHTMHFVMLDRIGHAIVKQFSIEALEPGLQFLMSATG